MGQTHFVRRLWAEPRRLNAIWVKHTAPVHAIERSLSLAQPLLNGRNTPIWRSGNRGAKLSKSILSCNFKFTCKDLDNLNSWGTVIPLVENFSVVIHHPTHLLSLPSNEREFCVRIFDSILRSSQSISINTDEKKILHAEHKRINR